MNKEDQKQERKQQHNEKTQRLDVMNKLLERLQEIFTSFLMVYGNLGYPITNWTNIWASSLHCDENCKNSFGRPKIY
jgi:hypothetical protein